MKNNVINLNRDLTPVEKNLLKVKKIYPDYKKPLTKRELKQRVQRIIARIDEVLEPILKERRKK